MYIDAGSPMRFRGQNNSEARVSVQTMAMDLTCAGEEKRRTWNMVCTIDSIALAANAYRAEEQGSLDIITAQYQTLLSAATIQLEFRKDGRINLVDVEGVSKHDEEASEIHEVLRQLVRRSLAPLDIQWPRNGQIDQDDDWKRRSGAIAFELFTDRGTFGGSIIEYVAPSVTDESITMAFSGHGNVSVAMDPMVEQGMAMDAGGSGSSPRYALASQGQGRFDVAAGHWNYADFTTSGEMTGTVITGVANQYTQAAWVGIINPDGTVEGLLADNEQPEIQQESSPLNQDATQVEGDPDELPVVEEVQETLQ